jgi:uncharacterized lipoprotein YbaY
MRKLALFPLTIALALSACGGESTPPAGAPAPAASAPAEAAPIPPANTPITGPRIAGRVEVTDLTSLPATGTQLAFKLFDVTDAAVAPVVVAEQITGAPRNLPYDFEFGYDAARIDQSRRYVMEASIQSEGFVLYGTPAPTPVLTQGAGDSGFVLNLVRGGKPVSTVPPSEQLKLDFAALEAQLGALRRIKGERLEEEVAVGWDAFVDDGSGQVRMAREQVDYGDAGTAEFRFAYQGGQPWVVERKQGGATTLLGWTTDGQLILNEKGGAQASDEEIAELKQRASALYSVAAARR